MNDFYIFEVLKEHEDITVSLENIIYKKGERFIGWEEGTFKRAVKSNVKELTWIPIKKVKKVYKINFEEINK